MGGPDKYLSHVYSDQAPAMFSSVLALVCVCVRGCVCLPSPSLLSPWCPTLVKGEDARVRAVD